MKLLFDHVARLAFLIVVVYSDVVPAAKAQLFQDAAVGLPQMRFPSAAWGDYDGDGLLDLLLAGMTSSNRITEVWHNTGSGFTNINAGLPGIDNGTLLWGDYNNDGRLDILLTGNSDTGPILQIWRNLGTGFTNINAGLPAIFGS